MQSKTSGLGCVGQAGRFILSGSGDCAEVGSGKKDNPIKMVEPKQKSNNANLFTYQV
jgi:hypothetical protein